MPRPDRGLENAFNGEFKPDMYAGADGSPNNDLYFREDDALRLRHVLDVCIERQKRMMAGEP